VREGASVDFGESGVHFGESGVHFGGFGVGLLWISVDFGESGVHFGESGVHFGGFGVGLLWPVSVDFRSDFGVILGSVLSAAINAFNQGRACIK
jgi:hypothetical protein